MDQKRYDKGMETLGKITASSGKAVIDNLKAHAPELADWIVEFAYGDVMSRPGLDLRTRQLATVAALTALGTAAPQLKVHLNGALNVGCTKEEIMEVMLQMAVYAGFPAALNGIFAFREVCAQRDGDKDDAAK